MVAESESERAKELIGRFNNAFNKTEYNKVPLNRRSVPFLDNIVVSSEGVIKLLKGLYLLKTLGPDELRHRVLKELADELGPIFAHLFQQSLDTGEIPKERLLANICPQGIGLLLVIIVPCP